MIVGEIMIGGVVHERVECSDCMGTGRDATAWDGRCPFCDGGGDRIVPVDTDDHDACCGDPECCS